MKWSSYQTAIFEAVKNLSSNLKIEALAGSGKTTTLIQCLSYIPSNWLALAFNNRNEADLKARAPSTGKVFNFNKLGFYLLHKNLKNPPQVEVNKSLILLEKLTKKSQPKDCLYEISQLVGLAKSCLVSSEEEILDLMKEHDFSSSDLEDAEFADLAFQCLNLSKQEIKIIDLQDQVWLPLVLELDFPEFGNIFVDEAQDLDPAQVEFVVRLANQNEESRVVYFGDKHQAMYQFRGAKNAIELLDSKFNPVTLPLSISYRNANKIIKLAQTIVPEIEARPDAPEGITEFITQKQMLEMAKPGCFILSRTNAPLISLVFHFLKQKIPCNIQGRKIGIGFLSLIYKSKAKTILEFQKFLLIWAQDEKKKLEELKKSNSLLLDKIQCLMILYSSVSSIQELTNLIKKLFSDQEDESKIICSTVHKAKGLEREAVFVLTDTFFGQSEEENNIRYVSYTRAKNELYLVRDLKKKKSFKETKIIPAPIFSVNKLDIGNEGIEEAVQDYEEYLEDDGFDLSLEN